MGATAQNGWNWPEKKELFDLAQEKQAYYKVLMKQSDFQMALDELQWLYDNNANLNPFVAAPWISFLSSLCFLSKKDFLKIRQRTRSALLRGKLY